MSIQETRKELKQRSNEVAGLVEAGEYDNINQAVICEFYANKHNVKFQKFREWVKQGYKIKKGSKGFPVWGRPLEVEKKTEEGEDKYDYWPICYLFSNAQVEIKTSKPITAEA